MIWHLPILWNSTFFFAHPLHLPFSPTGGHLTNSLKLSSSLYLEYFIFYSKPADLFNMNPVNSSEMHFLTSLKWIKTPLPLCSFSQFILPFIAITIIMSLVLLFLDLPLNILKFLDFTVHCSILNPYHDSQYIIGIQWSCTAFMFCFI